MTEDLDGNAAKLLETIELLQGSASPAELSRATGLSPRTVTKHLTRLRQAGCVEGSQRLPTLTPAGRARLVAPAPAPRGSWAEAIEETWPPAYAALIRLLLDAIVARALAPDRRGQPGFIVFGPIHTFKTSIADFVSAALGEPADANVAPLHLLAPGEIIGRRSAGGNGPFRPSRWTRGRFVCFDELGQADEDTRRRVRSYLHGESVVTIESEEIALSPTALVCFNQPDGAGDLWPLPEATWRRCIRLATAPVRGSLAPDMARRLQAWHRGSKPVPLDLARLSLPGDALPDECWELFDGRRGFYARCLTERGRHWHDRRTFELCVLGRAARLEAPRDASLEALALGVGVDLLTVADTLPGLVADSGWTLDVGRLRSLDMLGADDVANAIEAVEEQRKAARARAATAERSAAVAGLELSGARAALQMRLSEAIGSIRQVPPEHREAAAALKKQLGVLRDQAGHAGAQTSLEKVEELTAPYVRRVAELRSSIEAERRGRAQTLESARAELRSIGRLSGRRQGEARAIRAAIKAAAQEKDEAGFTSALQEVSRRTHALASAVDQDRWQAETSAEAKRAQRTRAMSRNRRLGDLRKLRDRRRTKPGESVADVLVDAGVLFRRENQRTVEVAPSLTDRLLDRLMRETSAPMVTTETIRYYVDSAGNAYWPHEVGQWESAAVHAAIAAAMERT